LLANRPVGAVTPPEHNQRVNKFSTHLGMKYPVIHRNITGVSLYQSTGSAGHAGRPGAGLNAR
jgi:hypothetical protein